MKKQKYYLVFSEQALDGVICREVDLKHWTDASAMVVEIDEEMIDALNNIISVESEC
jgi:hypothetical protein